MEKKREREGEMKKKKKERKMKKMKKKKKKKKKNYRNIFEVLLHTDQIFNNEIIKLGHVCFF